MFLCSVVMVVMVMVLGRETALVSRPYIDLFGSNYQIGNGSSKGDDRENAGVTSGKTRVS